MKCPSTWRASDGQNERLEDQQQGCGLGDWCGHMVEVHSMGLGMKLYLYTSVVSGHSNWQYDCLQYTSTFWQRSASPVNGLDPCLGRHF